MGCWRRDLSNVPVVEFLAVSDRLLEVDAERVKSGLTNSAFVAWLSSGSDMSFGSFLGAIGLGDSSEPLTESDRKEIAERSIKIAERIRRLDKAKNAKTV